GAIAELERGITAERVAEDMKLRAKRGKWNGGMAPYGRRLVDGRLVVVPEEAEVLQRMRLLLKEKRSWRGVTIALNHEGRRTRGWEPAEKNGRTARKGKPPSEWTPTTVKRVLLQRINEGTLVYNRRQAKGRTHAPRPEEEHVVVEDYCEPIFSREEMAEVLRIAAEIEGEPPRRTGSEHLLSGLVYCHCGSRMHAAKNYVTTARGRYPLVYYRCRRASHNGTCTMRQVPAAALEPVVVRELRTLGLDPDRLRALAGAAKARFQQEVQPLFERREALMRGLDRLGSRAQALLELAEDRLITKAEFVDRKERLEGERQAWEDELAGVEAELEARAATAVDIEGTLASLRRLSDVYEELEEVSEQRRLLEICLGRLVIRPEAVELHPPAYPTLVVRLNDGAEEETGAAGAGRAARDGCRSRSSQRGQADVAAAEPSEQAGARGDSAEGFVEEAMDRCKSLFEGRKIDHEARELRVPVPLHALQHPLVEQVLRPAVGDSVRIGLGRQELANLAPVDGKISLLVEIPEVVEVARPIPEPPPIAEMLAGLQEGPQLLGRDLFESVGCHGDVQRLARELVDQVPLDGPGQQRLLRRDLDLEAAVRVAHPGELDAHAEDALAARVLLAMALLRDDDLEGAVGQELRLHRVSGLLEGVQERDAAPRRARGVVEVLGEAVAREVSLPQAGAALEDERLAQRGDGGDTRQEVAQGVVLLQDELRLAHGAGRCRHPQPKRPQRGCLVTSHRAGSR
nr:recombinase family protein [Dehalococcoidales bacterium]